MIRLKRLLPGIELVAWMALILYLSSDSFQSIRTLYALQYWSNLLGLDLSAETLGRLNYLIRKGAHFGQFFVLGVLAYRALTGVLSPFQLRAATYVLIGGVLFASLDEWRQSLSGWRTASAWDVLLDSCGIVASQVWIWFRSGFGKLAVGLR